LNRIWMIHLCLFVLIASLSLRPILSAETDSCTDEDYAIFGAALKEMCSKQKTESAALIDLTSQVPPNWPNVIRRPGKTLIQEVPTEVREDFESRNRNRAKIDVDKIKAQFQILPVNNMDVEALLRKGGWGAIHQKYPNVQSFASLSRPGMNRARNRALLYVSVWCGSVCGGGSLVLLSKESDEWKVTNVVTVWEA